MVEQSRRACSAVANGEADCAIIGGDVPDELAHVLKVSPWGPVWARLGSFYACCLAWISLWRNV